MTMSFLGKASRRVTLAFAVTATLTDIPLKRAAVADKAANHRHYLADVTSNPDRNEIEPANALVRRVETNPAGARYID